MFAGCSGTTSNSPYAGTQSDRIVAPSLDYLLNQLLRGRVCTVPLVGLIHQRLLAATVDFLGSVHQDLG